MEKLTDVLPIALTNLLNYFNEELEGQKNLIVLKSTSASVKVNNSDWEEYRLRYELKNTAFYFQINYVVKLDFFNWIFYPFHELSTKPTIKARSQATSGKYQELNQDFKKWKDLVKRTKELKNPLDFFKYDDFITFYSGEVLDQLPSTEIDKKFPLPSEKQGLAIKLLKQQSKFLVQEIKKEEEIDSSSDKYSDLVTANKLLIAIQNELPRMTAEEVKRNWSISFGIIMKWCAEQFLKFTKLDSANNNDISRAIGGFIGGIFGIPKFEQ